MAADSLAERRSRARIATRRLAEHICRTEFGTEFVGPIDYHVTLEFHPYDDTSVASVGARLRTLLHGLLSPYH